MFSSFTNYLWGANGQEGEGVEDVNIDPPLAVEEDTNAAGVAAVRPRNPPAAAGGNDDDDWVVVGPSPAPGSLSGNLSPLVLSNDSSPAGSVAGSDDSSPEPSPAATAAVVRTSGRHGHQIAASSALHHAQVSKLNRLAQAGQVKHVSKAVSSKSLKRSNKAVIQYNAGSSGGQKKTTARHNLSIKMAGANKNLKQC